METYYHIYVSNAVRPFTVEELAALLEKARANNSKLGITGMLLYKDGTFMQALEGPERPVLELVRKIEADPRHRRMMKLLSGTQTERQFPDWSMGFQDMNSPQIRALPGYNDFLDLPADASAFDWDRARCMRVLTTLKKLSY